MFESLSKKAIFRILPSLLFLGVLLLGFAGAPENIGWLNSSPLWGPGDPFYTEEWAETQFIASPLLIWRGRPHHQGTVRYEYAGVENNFTNNAFGFRDDEIKTPKPSGTIRILNVGDSSTWGLNLESRSHTYSDQLEEMLNKRPADASPPGNGRRPRYEVINAGTLGYSSLQAAQFLRHRIAELEPDVVTIYIGNNDPQRSGTSDANRVSATAGPLQNLLSRNFFYLLAQKSRFLLRKTQHEEARKRLIDDIVNKSDWAAYEAKERYYRDYARVSPDQYEQNLKDIISIVKEAGARLILLKVPMNLLWPPVVRPMLHFTLALNKFWLPVYIERGYLTRARSDQPVHEMSLLGHPYLSRVPEESWFRTVNRLRAEAGLAPWLSDSPDPLKAAMDNESLPPRKRLRAANQLGVWWLIHGDLQKGLAHLERAVADSHKCDGCLVPWESARLHYSLGIAYFLLGRDRESVDALYEGRRLWPFPVSPDYEARFNKVVREIDVEWIDLPRLFAQADPDFGGSALMHDWVHPNQEGGRIIAKAIAGRL